MRCRREAALREEGQGKPAGMPLHASFTPRAPDVRHACRIVRTTNAGVNEVPYDRTRQAR